MKTRLYISWYNDKNEVRAKEMEECLLRNLHCQQIDEVVNLSDVIPPATATGGKPLTHKFQLARPTFADFFVLIEDTAGSDDISLIANNDIFFDQSIARTKEMPKGAAYALSRWDVKGARAELFDRKDSQDVWVIRGKPKALLCVRHGKPTAAAFYLGIPGCDNRIAYLMEQAGYAVTNPSKSITCYHLHESNVRNYMNVKQQSIVKPVAPPYKMVPPTYLPVKGKMLYVGIYDTKVPQRAFRQALASISPEGYIEMDWRESLKKLGKSGLNEHIVKMCADNEIGTLFLQIQTPDVIMPEVMDRIPAFKINWSGDVRENIEWFVQLGKHVDLTLFTNETDVAKLRDRGVVSDYLQISGDEFQFNKTGGAHTTKHEVVFFGNHYGKTFPLSGYRQEMADAMKRTFGKQFALFGSGWSKADANLMYNEEMEAAIYRGCKIAINLSHFNYKRYTSDRLYRMMQCGAFSLSHHYDGIEQDFEVGKHLDTWKTIEELIEKTRYYLTHEKERNQIAEAGYRHVITNHSFAVRAAELQKLISDYEH